MLIAIWMSRRTAGISKCPPSSVQRIAIFPLCVFAKGCVLCAEGCWGKLEGRGSDGTFWRSCQILALWVV